MYTQLLNNLLQLKLIEILINVELYECLCKNDRLNKKYTICMIINKNVFRYLFVSFGLNTVL